MPGKVVIVTGAFGVLGRAVVRGFAEAGAKVGAIDLAAEPPEGYAALIGEGMAVGGCDLTDAADAKAAIDRIAQHFGAVDALINVAGGFVWETVGDGSLATWDRLYAMNVKTCLNASKAALPHLTAARGRIVNIGAGGALNAAAGMGAYAASKSGVQRLTEALAQELKGSVQVNAVLPSIIDTPTNRADMPKANFAAWVQPDELAGVIRYLATAPEAAAITGALIPVSGRV